MAQEGLSERLRIATGDGKYEVVQEAGGALYANRYGERWRELTGDGLVLALACEIEEAREKIAELEQRLCASEPEASPSAAP